MAAIILTQVSTGSKPFSFSDIVRLADGSFVGAADSRDLYSAPATGLGWTLRQAADNYTVAYNGTNVVGRGASFDALYSPDGIGYSVAVMPNSLGTNGSRVVWTGTEFYMTAGSANGNLGNVSATGASWSGSNAPPVSTLGAMCYDGARIIAFGNTATNWASTPSPGSAWTNHGVQPALSPQHAASDGAGTTVVACSSNGLWRVVGTTWTECVLPTGADTDSFAFVVWNEITGQFAANGRYYFVYSDDGITWGATAFPWSNSPSQTAVLADGTYMIYGLGTSGVILHGVPEPPNPLIYYDLAGPGTYSSAYNLSPDGNIAVGEISDVTDALYLPFKWTVGDGIVLLPLPVGFNGGWATAANTNATIIGGGAYGDSEPNNAIFWSPGGIISYFEVTSFAQRGMTETGMLYGSHNNGVGNLPFVVDSVAGPTFLTSEQSWTYGQVTSASSDGAVLGGFVHAAVLDDFNASVWIGGSTVGTDVPVPSTASPSEIYYVLPNGSAVFGHGPSAVDSSMHAFSWNLVDSEVTFLDDTGIADYSEVRYASPNGAFVVGLGRAVNTDPWHAVFWSGGVVVDMGAPSGVYSVALHVNDAGTQVRGYTLDGGNYRPFLWTAEGGFVLYTPPEFATNGLKALVTRGGNFAGDYETAGGAAYYGWFGGDPTPPPPIDFWTGHINCEDV